jgi:hypothetical protein
VTQKRKFVYFLGAGASYGAGGVATIQAGGHISIPTQATFWTTFLRLCISSKRRKDIESFLFRYFLGYRRTPARLNAAEKRELLAPVDVEEVFTFLSERVRAPSTSQQLRTYSVKIWDALISEIGNVFRRFEANAQTKKTYRALIKNHIKSFDVIISFNYDTIFEDSIQHDRLWAYGGVEPTIGKTPILKPHGSVNWALSDGGNISIDTDTEKSVVVAPTHLKFVSSDLGSAQPQAGYLDQSREIRDIWSEMENHMKSARALVFIGYSFPISDLYFSSVLRSILADRDISPDVVLVNPDSVAIAQRLESRFALSKVVRYFDLAQFVNASRAEVIAQFDS